MDCKLYHWSRAAAIAAVFTAACGGDPEPSAAPSPPSAEEQRLSTEREERAVSWAAERDAAIRVETARLERVAQQAPAAAATWQRDIESVRARVMAGDESVDAGALGVPSDCPPSLPPCAGVAQAAAAARDELVPLVEWMAAVSSLRGAEAQIDEGGVVQQPSLDDWDGLLRAAMLRPEPCPTAVCSRARASSIDRAAAKIERLRATIPLRVASVSEMQLRYAAAMSGELRGQSVMLRYPRRNPVCEASQAEWVTAE